MTNPTIRSEQVLLSTASQSLELRGPRVELDVLVLQAGELLAMVLGDLLGRSSPDLRILDVVAKPLAGEHRLLLRALVLLEDLQHVSTVLLDLCDPAVSLDDVVARPVAPLDDLVDRVTHRPRRPRHED